MIIRGESHTSRSAPGSQAPGSGARYFAFSAISFLNSSGVIEPMPALAGVDRVEDQSGHVSARVATAARSASATSSASARMRLAVDQTSTWCEYMSTTQAR